jgi:CHAT domain-containing protein
MFGLRTVALGVLGTLGLSLSGSPAIPRPTGHRAEIMEAVGACRFTEARLTGVFPYLPWTGETSCSVDRKAMARLDLVVGKELSRHPNSELFADAALLKMVAGQWDDVIDLLEQGLAISPDAPDLLSELGAAYLTRAAQPAMARPEDPVLALAALEKAVAANPSSSVALFDRALALERLSLRKEALHAWGEALRADAGSDWAREADSHARELERPSPVEQWKKEGKRLVLEAAYEDDAPRVAALVKARPHAARLLGEQDLLGLWAEAAAHGQEQVATRFLAAARWIGVALADSRGDALLKDAIAAIDTAPEGSARRSALIDGHRIFHHALKLEQKDRFEEAATEYTQARRLLSSAETPFARVATVHLGVTAYYCNRHGQALQLYAEAISGVDSERYPTLVGYSFWMRGVVEFVTAALPEALASHINALRYFEKTGESAHAGFVHSLIAADLTSLGEREKAWSHRLQALSKLAEIEDPRRVYSVSWAASEAALAEGKPRLALYLLDELLATAPSRTLPGVSVEAFARRGVVEAQLSDTTAALRDLAAAKALLTSVPDDFRDRVRADLLVAEAQVKRRYEPLAAIELMTNALAYFQGADYRIDSAVFRQERAAGYRQVGDLDRVEADLAQVLDDYTADRLKIGDEIQKRLYIQQVQRVYDDMIALQMDRNRPERAFDFADRAHSELRGPEASGSQHGRVRVPDGQAVVEYSALEDRVVAWILTGTLVRSQVLPVRGAKDLEDRVARFREEIQERRELREGRRLYDDLFRPLESFLAGARAITFIPDKSLHGLPFSALYDEQRSRFLVQDYEISVAPSATRRRSSVGRVEQGRRTPTALVVAGDLFDQEKYPSLSQLRGARREAEEIANLYPGAMLLSGSDATRKQVLRLLPQYEIVHLASHAISIGRVGRSVILLAPAGDPERGAVAVEDLFPLDLARTRLVILAACSTAAGETVTEEGLLSLTSPFLRAGVPVVASLWNISDVAGVRFFTTFHRYLASGIDFAAALRKAQLAFLEGSRDQQSTFIALWAGIEIFESPRVLLAY